VSDNGPQFSSQEYSDFAKTYPYFPQSNREAERAVGTVKNLLTKEKDVYMALLTYRSTPLNNGYSPSELLMSRKLRTNIPISKEQQTPQVPDMSIVRKREETLKMKQKQNFDNCHKAKQLSHLDYRDVVWVPQQETEAVVNVEVAPRSYELVTAQGSIFRRNKRDIIQLENGNDSSKVDSPQNTPAPMLEHHQPRASQRSVQPPVCLDSSWT
jgi:hypothetical protein